MRLSDKKSIQHIASALAGLGVKEVILCPGSRNAPLVICFNRHPAFRCTSIRDERSAAFFALGKAIELQEPVAMVCTSGSATLNFAPAVSEAYYQRIPLIVLTADRPKEWTGQGDGQTINQTNVYRNFIRKSFELKGDAASPADIWYNDRCLSEGLGIATVSDRGPVHFNIPLSEPLYGTADTEVPRPKIFRPEKTEKKLSEEGLAQLSGQFTGCKKVMILAGQYPADHTLQRELSAIAERENVAVLTESTSNLHDPYFIENIDRCITGMSPEEAKEFMPELLITVGGAVVSKRIKAFLRKYRPEHHWNIDPFDAYMDTYQSLTRAVFLNPATVFHQLQPGKPAVPSDYRTAWMKRKHRRAGLHDTFCATCGYSDLRLFYQLYHAIPENIFLHLANSSPIRYAQLFDNRKIANSWSNRGTSGIDGCTSTAMGAAAASPEKDFLLITGDVAFRYDINALWNEAKINNLRILVINNGGGGIFRIISGPDRVDELEEYFETAMETEAQKIAQQFHWNYWPAKDETSLKRALDSFFAPGGGRTILEVFTPAEKNPEVLDQYWNYLNENQTPHERSGLDNH